MNIQIQHIWTDLHQELKRFIVSKVQNNNDADDILQEVFVKVIVNLESLKDQTKLTSWVYQITRNTITDFYNKNKRLELDIHLSENGEDDPMYEQLSNCINSKIAQLPDKYKEAICLTTFENFSQLEMAKKLNISYSGLKSRVQRGREMLKQDLINCENNDLAKSQK